MESRTRFGQGTWAPVAVAQNDGTAKTVSFRVPCSRQTEMIRVRADTRQALPISFYGGTNVFTAPLNSSGGPPASGPGGV
ncbi:MAG TPA: hypothetical protein VH598_09845, partial [Verrucomicrobiae bacterium]|nr:hypothetical protein [Verrucomicrobiae bacterium]